MSKGDEHAEKDTGGAASGSSSPVPGEDRLIIFTTHSPQVVGSNPTLELAIALLKPFS